jgi:ribonucleoside-diphosphate reductase alpha chain
MHMGKAGGCAMSQLEAIGRLVSLGLRSGIEVESITEQLRGIRCPSPSWEKGGRIFSCSDAIARAIEKSMQKRKEMRQAQDTPPAKQLPQAPAASMPDAEGGTASFKAVNTEKGSIVGVCPDCGGVLWHIEGCMVCKGCGYSKCG